MCFKTYIGSSKFSGTGSTFLSYSKQSKLICDIMLVYVHVKSHLRAKYVARKTWHKFTDLSKAHDSHIYVLLLLIIFVQHEANLHNKKSYESFLGKTFQSRRRRKVPGLRANWTLCLLEPSLSLWTLTPRLLIQDRSPFKTIIYGY